MEGRKSARLAQSDQLKKSFQRVTITSLIIETQVAIIIDMSSK